MTVDQHQLQEGIVLDFTIVLSSSLGCNCDRKAAWLQVTENFFHLGRCIRELRTSLLSGKFRLGRVQVDQTLFEQRVEVDGGGSRKLAKLLAESMDVLPF